MARFLVWLGVVLMLLVMAGVAAGQGDGLEVLGVGCDGGTSWVIIKGTGVVRYVWSDATVPLTAGEADFDRWETWRLGFAGFGRAVRFDAGGEAVYFDVDCQPVEAWAPVSPLPIRASVEVQRVYLPMIGR